MWSKTAMLNMSHIIKTLSSAILTPLLIQRQRQILIKYFVDFSCRHKLGNWSHNGLRSGLSTYRYTNHLPSYCEDVSATDTRRNAQALCREPRAPQVWRAPRLLDQGPGLGVTTCGFQVGSSGRLAVTPRGWSSDPQDPEPKGTDELMGCVFGPENPAIYFSCVSFMMGPTVYTSLHRIVYWVSEVISKSIFCIWNPESI